MNRETAQSVIVLVNGKIEATWDGKIVPCRGCGKDIGFAVTRKSGKPTPFDIDDGHTSHFATCPKVKEFRK